MLTKEGCEKAKEILRMANDYPVSKYNDSDLISNAINAFENLIHEHFDNNQIDWLKNCMGEEAFNVVFSSEEEVKKWIDRIKWHVKKVDELGRELQKLKSNPPLKFEELKLGMWVWDNVDKEYRQIESKAKKDWVWFYINYRKEHVDEFYEENRFYRKQVEE